MTPEKLVMRKNVALADNLIKKFEDCVVASSGQSENTHGRVWDMSTFMELAIE